MIKCNLSMYMGKYKMNIEDVKEKTGLGRSTISGLKNEIVKRIDYETIEKLCRLFNCSIGEMFEMEDNPE